VLEAAAAAQASPSGPVYLGIPTDLLGQSAPELPPVLPAAAAPRGPVAADLDRAIELLDGAERPLIWAGGGALRAGAGAVVGELAVALAAPVMTTYMSRGLLPCDHPCAVPGPVHAEPVGKLWDEADVVLAVGSDLDGMMTQNWLMPPPPALIAVNVDAADAGKNYAPDVTLVGDARRVLEELLPRVAGRGDGRALTRRLQAVAAQVTADVAADEPQAAQLLESLDRVLPANAVVLADMCIPGYWLAGYRRVPGPRQLLYPVGWGTLGFAFPASLGASLAGAGPVVCVCGDGGFLFACGELATLAEIRTPLTVVLVDDGGYGMLRFDQRRAGEDPFGVDLVTPNFVALAASFGVRALAVEGFGAAFTEALVAALAVGEPRMVVVRAQMKPPPTTSPRWYRRGRELH
jgi:acetolactate synthase-1/2/3 large subunit